MIEWIAIMGQLFDTILWLLSRRIAIWSADHAAQRLKMAV